MLDTTKVQVQLREALEEKEVVCRDLQEQVAIVVQLRGVCICAGVYVKYLLEIQELANA